MFPAALRSAILLAGAVVAAVAVASEPVAAAPGGSDAPVPAEASQGLLGELDTRMREGRVRELRTSYDGDYGASLLVADDTVVCYLALLHHRKLWRVFRFDDFSAAEKAYLRLAQQNAAWAREAILGEVLTAQQRELARLTQESEARAGALDRDVRVMQAQRRQMLEEQRAMREQVQAAHVENRAARIRLEQLHKHIRGLETDLSDAAAIAPAPLAR